MASNSSAAAAAFFGIRDGDQQDQIKPLISPQQQQLAAALPGVAGAAPAPASGQGAPTAAAQPPPKKKRTLPDPDAEVIALSPKTLLATNRFVCEVCNKGFQREQNLQLHRRGHNLPWKLKQKNPLQPQRRRVYLCPEPTCVHHDPSRALGDLTGIKKHFCRKHGEKKWKCDKCSKRYAVQSDWKAHSKICGTREYRCDCGTLFSRRDSFITHRAFCDALAQESARLPPTSLSSLTGHLYGATNAGNMALSLSQVGSHLTSTLQDGHGHHHPSPELLRLGATAGGGGSIAARLDHLLSPSGASAFRPAPQAPPSSAAFFLNAAAAAGQDFGDDAGNGPHSFMQTKPLNSSFPKRFLRSSYFPPRRGPRLRAGSVKEWREFEDEAGAVKEWREFEDAIRRKDLSRALRFLQSVEPAAAAGTAGTQVVVVPVPPGRDWEVLDACIDADDMRLVGRAYQFLVERGVLANFGKCKNIVLEGPREVTPTVLKEMSGLEAAKLAPKKWGLSGSSPYVLIGFLGGVSFLLTQGIDLRPKLGAVLALATADAIFLGGTGLAQISCFWPPYKRRILVHEAGHLLTAYLMGCPIRGVILDPFVALRMGIQGQAGTQFWDEKMEKELAEGHLSSTAFDRYCMILFAGIAAEALVYGEAEGGENDENLFRSLCILLNPPLSVAQMANRARWSVMQSYNLLKWHKKAHRAAVKALEEGHSLSIVIRRIEESIASGR